MFIENYEYLANAIILKASNDYIMLLKDNRGDRKSESGIKMIEKFFRSGYFRILSDVDPEYLIENLRESRWAI